MNVSDQKTRYSCSERIEQIRQAIADGAQSAEEIATKIGLGPASIVVYARREGIQLPRKEAVVPLIRACVKGILDRGVRDLDAIIQEASKGTAWSSTRIATQARTIASEMEIALTGGKNIYSMKPRGEHVDNLVKQGCTLRKIGEAMGGVSRERARQYLHATGQYGLWVETKRKREDKEKRERQSLQDVREGLVSLLRNRVYQRAQCEGWAAQKAIEYMFTVNTPLQFTSIKRVFERYRAASSAGSRVSLAALGAAGHTQLTVSHILRRAGLEPMHTNYNRLTSKEREAIKRSERIPLSDSDVAYFIGVRKQTVIKRRSPRLNYVNHIKSSTFGHGSGCSFSTASQIYEARDTGFTNEEIVQLLGFKQATVDNAVKQREQVEPKIMHALRKLYGRNDVQQPYRNLKFLQ